MSQNVQKGMITLFSLYSEKDVGTETSSETTTSVVVDSSPNEQEKRPPKLQRLEDTIKHDPGLRQAIWKYPYREQDGIRRHYIGFGPCQPNLRDYPRNAVGRCFRHDWFKDYNWLEYSETTDKVFIVFLVSFLRVIYPNNTSYAIHIPDMSGHYVMGTSRSFQQYDEITVEHHYRFDILHETIDTQVMDISERLSDVAVELLSLSTILDPKDCFKSLKIHDLCMLVKKYYLEDFNEMEINHQLRHQLQHYESHIRTDPDFKNILTLPKLSRKLVKTGKSKRYPLVDRLIRLVLTLPVSTATTKRAFSVMKLIKTSLRNKMGDELLIYHILYIERDIAISLDPEAIVDEFDFRENRRVRLR